MSNPEDCFDVLRHTPAIGRWLVGRREAPDAWFLQRDATYDSNPFGDYSATIWMGRTSILIAAPQATPCHLRWPAAAVCVGPGMVC